MKKFISVLLSLLMVFSLCLSVSADDGKVAKIGDNEYSTLQEAINVAGDGDTIALIANTNEDVVIESEMKQYSIPEKTRILLCEDNEINVLISFLYFSLICCIFLRFIMSLFSKNV